MGLMVYIQGFGFRAKVLGFRAYRRLRVQDLGLKV